MREGGKVWVPLPFFIMMPSLQFRSSPKRERDRVQPSSRSVCIKHSVCTVQWPWKTRFALPDRSKSCLPAVCLPSAFRALAAQPAEDLDEQVLQTASNGSKRSSSASSLPPSLPLAMAGLVLGTGRDEESNSGVRHSSGSIHSNTVETISSTTGMFCLAYNKHSS